MSSIVFPNGGPTVNCGGGLLSTTEWGFGTLTQETPVQHCRRRLVEAQQELAAKLLGLEALRQEVAQLERMVAAAEPPTHWEGAKQPLAMTPVVDLKATGVDVVGYCGECQRLSAHGHFVTCSRYAK